MELSPLAEIIGKAKSAEFNERQTPDTLCRDLPSVKHINDARARKVDQGESAKRNQDGNHRPFLTV